jgi:hypothetical protein
MLNVLKSLQTDHKNDFQRGKFFPGSCDVVQIIAEDEALGPESRVESTTMKGMEEGEKKVSAPLESS